MKNYKFLTSKGLVGSTIGDFQEHFDESETPNTWTEANVTGIRYGEEHLKQMFYSFHLGVVRPGVNGVLFFHVALQDSWYGVPEFAILEDD